MKGLVPVRWWHYVTGRGWTDDCAFNAEPTTIPAPGSWHRLSAGPPKEAPPA
jgi:hypothetical protein